MPCGCQAACGCTVEAGEGIRVRRIGDRFIVESLDAVAGLRVVRGYWNFAEDGGAVGEIPLRDAPTGGDPLVLEEGAIVFNTMVRVLDSILPDELDPNPGGAEVKFSGGSSQLNFFQGTFAHDDETVNSNPNTSARSFNPAGTPLVLEVFGEITAGSIEVVFLVIPAP